MRTQPNIIITGTPGTGKSSHCELLASNTSLTHLSINAIAKELECIDGTDDELGSALVDEDRLLDTLEQVEDVKNVGGFIIDWHACDLFPESWIDLVVVLRAETNVLYDRLKARNYAQNKIDENMDAEIMQILLDEARESFEEQIVVELRSDAIEDLEANVKRIEQWIDNWKENKGKEQEED